MSVRLPWRKPQDEQTPARHHLADLIEPMIRGDERIRAYRRHDDDCGPLGGIADTFLLTFEHEGRTTRAKIVVYGDSPQERVERFGDG